MAPKKQKQQAPSKAPPHIDPNSSFTPESFESELKKLAEQAQQDTWTKTAWEQAQVYGKATLFIALAAIFSNVSQLTLSPVYGSIPSSVWHPHVVIVGCFTGWSANLLLRRNLPVKPVLVLPIIAAYVPMAQFYLFKLSGTLGTWGPVATELLTLFPLLVFSIATVADCLEQADFSSLPKWIRDAAPGLGSYGVFQFYEKFSDSQLQQQVGKTVFQTRFVLEALLAGLYALAAPSKLLMYSVPAVLHAAFFNSHFMTPMAARSLNASLNAVDWALVDRWESSTGYISVLDAKELGYRVMRCDHSLLGGEWTKLGRTIVAEPIYAVFTMLEAVRLVEGPGRVPDKEASALNIGLGIGTTPAALIAHGIDTTIVEIDQIVYDYAVKYFGLPPNHKAVIKDAVQYVSETALDETQRFDYIIHDVFTGGAEPIPLFTIEFLQSLHTLLKPNGVIAINYAGDITLPPSSIVVKTIRSVFPSCRIFRESEAPDEDTLEEQGRDFTNMVIFCTKSSQKVTFRNPTQADYLQTMSRQSYLLPQHEVPESQFLTGEEITILRNNETEALVKWHQKSATGHWAVMRTVLPKEIWEMW